MAIYNELNLEAEVVLVTADRKWRSVRTIFVWLQKFKYLELVIQGADDLVSICSKTLVVPCLEVPAKWATQGKTAGPIRNDKMIWWLNRLHCDAEVVDYDGFSIQVLAFHQNLKNSKLTQDMCSKAKKAGYPVYLIDKETE